MNSDLLVIPMTYLYGHVFLCKRRRDKLPISSSTQTHQCSRNKVLDFFVWQNEYSFSYEGNFNFLTLISFENTCIVPSSIGFANYTNEHINFLLIDCK